MTLALAAAVSTSAFAQTQSDPLSNPASTEEKMEEKLENKGIKMRQKAANMENGTNTDRTLPQSTLPVADRANEPSEEDFNRMVRGAYNVELRSLVGKALNLDADQINGFTPIFMDYVKYKDALVERRKTLVSNYSDEMAEDDTAQDEENETADFIEDYLEIDIAEMELKKDYFDRLEDKIGAMNALKFFELEKQFNNRVQRIMMMESLPKMYLLIPNRSTAYDREMSDYRNWNKINITGNVGVDHNFTYNGLEKLMTAAEAMTKAEGINVSNFNSRKQMVMNKAAQLKKDWRSLNHADLAREAFTATAGVLKEVAMDSRFTARTEWINKLDKQAKAIKPSVKLTDQAAEVRAFFQTAETIVNDLVDQANGMSKK